MWSVRDNIVLAAATYYINNKLRNHNTLSLDKKSAEKPPRFYLPKGDSYSMNCGVIIMTTNNLMYISCAFCNYKYDSVSNFSQHVSTVHLHMNDESRKSLKRPAAENLNNKSRELNTKQKHKYQIKTEKIVSLESQNSIEEPVETAKVNELMIEPLFVKPENDFNDTKSDDEESLSSFDISLEPNIFSDSTYMTTYKCDKCDKVFRKKASLNIHIISHSNEKKYKCNLCEAQYKHENNLIAHKKRHNGIKKHKCGLCDKRFFTSTELNRHERVHTGEKPYVCFKCGKSFRTSGDLAEHMKRHDNFRPKNCEICGKNFYNTHQLKEHMAGHSSERAFVCTYCPSSFARSKTLRQHIKLHLNAKEYECNLCEKSFNQRPALLSHMNNNHKTL